jgi:hypothetical protein
MTPRIIDTKKLGLNNLGSMEIQCIATNSTASWVYLGRSNSLDRDYLNLIACEMNTEIGEVIGEPIFFRDSTQKSDIARIQIGKIIVDESNNLLYLCRATYPESIDLKDFEAITVYKLDPSGRPIKIVETCTTQLIGQNNKEYGVYNIAIHQNHLYAVGSSIQGVLIYELDNQGIPITIAPTNFFPTTACQQIEIINDKIYLGTRGIIPMPQVPTLQVADLDAKGIPILASIQTVPIPIGIKDDYLDFQISNLGIYPQKTVFSKSNRPSNQPLYYLPFDPDGLPILPLKTLTTDVRGFGVNDSNDLWFATDDTYIDTIDGSSGNRGIKVQTYPPANDYSVKLKFPRLVCVAKNGTPVLLCDSYLVNAEDFGNKNVISGWHIRFKLDRISYEDKRVVAPEIMFSLQGFSLKEQKTPDGIKLTQVSIPTTPMQITLKPSNWSADISLDIFLESNRRPMIFQLKLLNSSVGNPQLSQLEVEIEIYDRSPKEMGVKTRSLPPETTDGDLVEFWIPGYGVQDLPDLKLGESALEQRYSAHLIEWASQRVQRYLTELWRVAPNAAVQPKQYSVSDYAPIGYQPSRLQLHITAELLAYMGFNTTGIDKAQWIGLNKDEINNAVDSYLPYRDFTANKPLDGYTYPLCYFDFFLSKQEIRLNEWIKAITDQLSKNGAISANIRHIAIADEPSWGVNEVVNKIRDSADYLTTFHAFLENKTGLTAQDFGAKAGESFNVLFPALFTIPEGTSLPDRRLYYWTVRFLVESASDGFGRIAELIRGSSVGVDQPNLLTPVNKDSFGGSWSDTGCWHSNALSTYRAGEPGTGEPGIGEPDWFDLGRKNVPAIWAENWDGDSFGINLSYTANLMRCAANLGSEKNFGAYIRGLRLNDPLAPIYAVMTYAGYGCKNFSFFTYGHGPYQPDNSWSEYTTLYPAIRNALDMLGQAEDLLYPGKPPVAQVAVLHPGASDIWNEATNTHLYLLEAHGIYHALRHAGYAVDLIDEIELKDNFFSNNNYRVLYITGPNIPRSAIEPLKAWVMAGNTAIVTNGAAMRDEYHEKFVDADGVDSLLGLVSNSRTEDRTEIGSLLKNKRQYIKINNQLYGEPTPFLLADNSHLLQVKLDNIHVTVKTIVSDTTDTHIFATEHQPDPTVGRAITFGMYFGAAYMLNYNIGGTWNIETRNIRPTNWNPIFRKLIVAPVEQLSITKPVEIDQNIEIECCRLDSTAGIGIVLLNWSGKKAENLTFKVTNNGTFTNVKSVKQGILVANVVGANLEIELPSLETVDVLLIT